jgi:aryl-alcohol dehydrogenase-like predicted oxidoreductase
MSIASGTFSGRVQRAMGQEAFTRLIHHGYDRGIRFFDTAEGYQTHPLVGAAIKGLPRESFTLMTKAGSRSRQGEAAEGPLEKIERFRKELDTDYIDILLLHAIRTEDWAQQSERYLDGFSEAKQKGLVRAVGVSVHGLKPLRTVATTDWVDVALVRINHNGTRTDNEAGDDRAVGEPEAATPIINQIHAAGKGVMAMKVFGEGAFTAPEARDASFQKLIGMGSIDVCNIGFASIEEFDDAFDRMNRHLGA